MSLKKKAAEELNDLRAEYYEVRANLDEEIEDKVSWIKKNAAMLGVAAFALVVGFALGAALV
jgi:hypothetical protein